MRTFRGSGKPNGLSEGMRIRPARIEDAAAILAIYAPLVRASHVTFELEPPDVVAFTERILGARPEHPWLVCEEDEGIIGYAAAGRFRDRAAYDRTVEASVYVRPEDRRRGVGRALIRTLIAELDQRGARSVVGVVALPNEASERLLRRLAFRRVGVIEAAGFKLGDWWDVALWQLPLPVAAVAPMPPAEE